AAAIAVANRRLEYRQRSLARLVPDRWAPNDFPTQRTRRFNADVPGRSPERIGIAKGIQRDRALLAQVETYMPPEPVDPVSALKQWLKAQFFPAPPALPQLTASEIYAKAEPFTVEVWIVVEDGTSAPATGVIVSDKGLVLTNAHVVEGNPNPTIHIRDGQQNERQFPGQVIVEDRNVDLALIQLTGANQLPTAPFADSSTSVKVGDTVFALGSPVGSHWKLTQANVIAVQSQCGVPGLKCIRMPRGFLHPGNSGGPLLDQTGKVIGINRALQEATGEGVSIPIDNVKDFLRQQEELGKVNLGKANLGN
ncbi:MAG TPA: trypsin-like peptidase domain-containing protein, partial [Coleofasciculaceae cyanobacterium]